MKTIGFIALAILVTFLWTAVALAYWGWFIVPLGVPEVSFFHMLGLLFFAYVIRVPAVRAIEETAEESMVKIAGFAIAIGIFWLIGWTTVQLM